MRFVVALVVALGGLLGSPAWADGQQAEFGSVQYFSLKAELVAQEQVVLKLLPTVQAAYQHFAQRRQKILELAEALDSQKTVLTTVNSDNAAKTAAETIISSLSAQLENLRGEEKKTPP